VDSPVVGIGAWSHEDSYGARRAYVDAVVRAGGSVVLVPARQPASHRLADRLDALVLAGGGDLDPATYGAKAHPEVSGVDAERDAAELALARAALERRLPVLGICRGMQVLNVARGGSLHQHLPELAGDGSLDHGTGRDLAHPVSARAGSALAAACGSRIEACVSHHHQAVDRLGEGLVPVAWSEDGLVEALEGTDPAAFVLAVQWHPERSAADDPAQQAVFDLLVRRATGARAG
jgi:putative glutamine amidotransferase